jgi:8-oxo-dGTP pyrophosphatase MutT (NUDIX family)
MKTINQTSAGGIVFKRIENGKLKIENCLWLICQHSQHKGWVFPKGLVGDDDSGESMEEAALREVEEEGGIKAKIIINKPINTNYQYRWPASAKASAGKQVNLIKKTVYYYLMEYVSGDPKNHDWEMMDAKFVSENEVKKILTYKSDKEAFEKILEIL